MAQFATAANLASYLGETFDASRTARADYLLQLASAAVQSHVGQRLERVVDDTVTLRGTFDTELRVPEHPVVAVASATVDGTAVAADTYWSAGGSLWRPKGWGGPGVTVTLVYTHGFQPIPEDITLICLQSASRAMANPQAIRQESIGSYSVTYAETTAGITGGVLLSDEEKRLLNRYRKTVLS